MKQHILNFVLVFVIAIGGVYLMQPATALAYCPDCETCTVPAGEEPCPYCFDDECDADKGTKCGTLESSSGKQIECWKPGEGDPGET